MSEENPGQAEAQREGEEAPEQPSSQGEEPLDPATFQLPSQGEAPLNPATFQLPPQVEEPQSPTTFDAPYDHDDFAISEPELVPVGSRENLLVGTPSTPPATPQTARARVASFPIETSRAARPPDPRPSVPVDVSILGRPSVALENLRGIVASREGWRASGERSIGSEATSFYTAKGSLGAESLLGVHRETEIQQAKAFLLKASTKSNQNL